MRLQPTTRDVFDTAGEPALCSRLEAAWPRQDSPGLSEKISRYLLSIGRKTNASLRYVVVSGNLHHIRVVDCQLTLPFAPPHPLNIVRFVPPHRRGFLDYGVYDSFRNVPGAGHAAHQLEAMRIYLVGQLVQLTEEQVRAYPFMDDRLSKIESTRIVPFCRFNFHRPQLRFQTGQD